MADRIDPPNDSSLTDEEWRRYAEAIGVHPETGEPIEPSLADRVRSYICDYGREQGDDHGHTDCWHLAMAAKVIDARDAVWPEDTGYVE